jgi:glucose-1-phosphate thymidylyltransferase
MYVHQRERLGLGHAVLQTELHVGGAFLLVNDKIVFIQSVASETAGAEVMDAALAVEEVSPVVARTTDVIRTDETRRVAGIVKKPTESLSTLITTVLFFSSRSILYCLW